MLHLPSFLDFLKWSWIKRITNENTANWKNIPLLEYKKQTNKQTKTNKKQTNKKTNKQTNKQKQLGLFILHHVPKDVGSMNKISPSIPILSIPISLEEGAASNDIIFPSLPWSSLSVGTRDHVPSYTCRSAVIFVTLKDDSLWINVPASKNCFSHRNIFQNGLNTLSKFVGKKNTEFWTHHLEDQKARFIFFL